MISAAKASYMVRKKRKLNPYLLLMLSFLGIVLIGSFLLSMPFAFKESHGKWCATGSYLDAFFTALGAMTLTGLTTYPQGLAATLSPAGQIIVLVLVQIGGLGIVTILTFLFSIFKKKLQFKERLTISQAIAFNNFSEIARYVRRLIIISLTCEAIGIGLGVPLFLHITGGNFAKSIYYSVFYAISSFNNAGFDLFNGSSALMVSDLFATNNFLYYYSTAYLSVLSLLGGISFLVIIDIVIGHKLPRSWSSFTKICLTMTVGLIVVMSGLLFLTDGMKPENPMSVYQAFSQIIYCRTSGFAVYPQDQISLPGRMICAVMMLIGGSPLSTAGGIKVTTAFIIILAVISYFRGKRLSAFKRRYSYDLVAKSMSLVFIVVAFICLSFICLVAFGTKNVEGYTLSENIAKDKVSFYMYEVFSCFGNVGFQTGIEPVLAPGSKIVLCLLMLVGHLGPMAFFQLFQNHLDKKANVHYSFVEEDFLIG